ncbi:hypothetical protein PAXRUDRAFT_827555 [Paxillus rubicundulus Ve08.2h10]|uniref:Uncharacterized protein n=1 Tax=Paxillus rubicundulus Ve08.2h10 TaxID=930991 RepID=A0A0D0DQQ2_9AGAM|nr:hypothetical protein PAXRUDRAFT_827555 [Paxillus rubicundulus Ve08.2h10]
MDPGVWSAQITRQRQYSFAGLTSYPESTQAKVSACTSSPLSSPSSSATTSVA